MKHAEPFTHFRFGMGCAHGAQTPLYDGVVAQCQSCGLGATTRVPHFTYDDSYFTADGQGGYNFDSALALAFDEARFSSELAHLERQRLRGTVLDIGCATGTFLARAQDRGWCVTGVEVAEFARAEAARRLQAQVVASLDELPDGARYDVVTLHHVLEHIHEPLEFLRTSVAPRVGRRLLIEVPNFDSLGSRVDGSRWRDLRPEQHVFHYTRRSLEQLVTAAGFRVVRSRTLWVPLWSLRSARELVRLVGGAVLTPDRRTEQPGAAARRPPMAPPPPFRPPQGVRRLATEISELAFRPLVLMVQRAGLGERLVVEASPRELT